MQDKTFKRKFLIGKKFAEIPERFGWTRGNETI